jgi:hypothetical protein
VLIRSSILGAALLLSSVGSGSAVTIFSDDFNRSISDTVGNLWTETESAPSSVSIVHVTGAAGDNQLKLQGSLGNNTDLDAAVAQLAGLSSAGLQNLSLLRFPRSQHRLNQHAHSPMETAQQLHLDNNWVVCLE